jgi:hypothetical protein
MNGKYWIHKYIWPRNRQTTWTLELHIVHVFCQWNVITSSVLSNWCLRAHFRQCTSHFSWKLQCKCCGRCIQALRSTGLRKTDPRLAEMMQNLREVHKQSGHEGGSPETQKLDRETFKRLDRNWGCNSNFMTLQRFGTMLPSTVYEVLTRSYSIFFGHYLCLTFRAERRHVDAPDRLIRRPLNPIFFKYLFNIYLVGTGRN